MNAPTAQAPKADNRGAVLIWSIVGLGVVGWLDRVTGPELALSILYLFPVGFCAWLAGRGAGLAVSALGAIIWTYFDLIEGRPYANQWIPYWNGAVRMAIFAIMALLLDVVRNLTHNLQSLVQQRTAALEAEIRSRKEVERIVTEISFREQQRLGADLHDQLAGHLTGVAFLAKAISESLRKRGLPEGPEAEKLVGFLNQSLKQLRAFCRLLAPVDSGNLEPGLTRLGAEIETAFGITCIVQTPKDPPQLGLNRARLLYSIAQEAVRRAVEKRMAKNVEITLTEEAAGLKLIVTDDGSAEEADVRHGDPELNLRIMRYRAETLGGTVTASRGEAGGSRIVCEVPLEKGASVEPFPPFS